MGLLLALGSALLLASCGAAPPAPATAGPHTYDATLWPQRPVVTLAFTMAPDLRSAQGRETVVFTPDMPTCDLVLRAWPNTPTMSTTGTSLVLTDATVDGRAAHPQVTSAGAPPGAPGTLIDIPLPECIDRGRSVQADVGFQVALGVDADERIGVSPDSDTAWIGSGFPLLAWVRGSGWVRDPAVPINGESTTSEDFELRDLSVTAPTGLTVSGTGTATGEQPGPPGMTTHRFSAPAVRDVSFGVGRYAILDRDVGGVHVHVATPQDGTRATPQAWADQVGQAITTLTGVFGPFPYSDLWILITPGQSDGTEYPATLQMSDARPRQLPALIAHEVSHQWFYALVGNDQSTDPWLDESLATLGEAIAGGDADDYTLDMVPTGDMGQSMTYWAAHGGFDAYSQHVYDQGAAVLLEARREVGDQRFDSALRAYIVKNAHRVATPADFASAFHDQPQVLDLLDRAGAFVRTAGAAN